MAAVAGPSGELSLPFMCESCGKGFPRQFNLRRHRRFHCPAIGEAATPLPPQFAADHHSNNTDDDSDSEVMVPPVISGDLGSGMFVEFETAFRGRLKSYRLRHEASAHVTIPEFLVSVYEELVTLMHRVLEQVTAVKVNLWLECEFADVHGQTCRRAFKTKNVAVFRSTDLEDLSGVLFQKLVDEKESCAMKGSGWAFVRVIDMEVRINVYRPLGGSSYIPLPANIKRKRAVINVLNDADEKCFAYAILTKFINNPNRQQLRAEDFTQEVYDSANLDFTGLDFPVRLEQIQKFEKNNGVSVNVYGLDIVKSKRDRKYRHIVYPLRVAEKEMLHPNHFDLLFLTNERTTHYCFITDFGRLVHSQITLNTNRIYVCKRCFAHFGERPTSLGLTGAQRLYEHRRYCDEHAALRTDIAEHEKIRFDKPERSQRVRFTIYADFECALVPYDDNQPLDPPSTVQPPAWDPATDRGELPHHHQRGASLESAHVRTKTIHKPYSYAYYVRDGHLAEDDITNPFREPRLYRGEDAAQHFMRSIRDDVQRIGDILYATRQNVPQLSDQEEAEFQAATVCHICNRTFTENEMDDKVRDHQHSPPYTYRGAAHRSCNLRFKEQTTVNCYFHNLSNYDAHFIVRELAVDDGEVNVLANTEEKYISFSKRFIYPGAGRQGSIRLRFLDSYRFLSKGLANLASILPVNKMKITNAHFPDPEDFELVRRKGVFPYEHITSLEVLEEDVLPPPEAFRDNLRMEDVKPEDYTHAQRVWNKFQCATLGDYSDIYLKTDVVLLADIFEGFRDMCLQHYGLDPAHWLTLPSYAWDVMLFKTNVTLDTLQDVDQYLFFEKGIRGGLAQCVTRHAVAKNKYTGHGDGDGDYIMYYDANNLYGWAMSQPLPYGEFEWLSPDEVDALNIGSIPADGEDGYVLEVDIEYPNDTALHDRHRDLPFCPEVRRAPVDQLPYSDDIIQNNNSGKSPKLMVTLLDKDKYVIHYRLLQQALENGLRVRRIHRVLRFKQSPWLKPYVDLNTRLRQQTDVKFEIELFKLMNNAVYGMSLQNVRKHINIKLATSPDIYTKYVAKSNFGDRTWYSENLALLHMAKVRVVLDKPVYVGMCILDHSKWWMYRFHYKMQQRYGLDRIRLLYMDTDSLVYKIRTVDIYRDMFDNRDDFDTSNYPQGVICYSNTNAKVLGKFKDEAGGEIISEFIGLMAKLYCMLFHDGAANSNNQLPVVKRAKGVNRAVVAKQMTVDDYRRCLFDQTIKHTNNMRFQSRHHIIYTVEVAKRSLAPYDDKRYVIPEDGVNTLPWGHYAIPPQPAAAAPSELDILVQLLDQDSSSMSPPASMEVD